MSGIRKRLKKEKDLARLQLEEGFRKLNDRCDLCEEEIDYPPYPDIYDDIIMEIHAFLKERAEYALFCDIKKENIIVDPGIGFGKRTGGDVEDNCEILYRLSELKSLGYPVLVGASRKTFIGNICGNKKSLPVSERLEGSLAAACIAVMNGADIIRVHDVKETRRCIDMVDCVVRKTKN